MTNPYTQASTLTKIEFFTAITTHALITKTNTLSPYELTKTAYALADAIIKTLNTQEKAVEKYFNDQAKAQQET